MPYQSASATRSITVQATTVTLTVSPSPPWTAGQTITLSALVVVSGTPVSGRTVWFYREHPSGTYEAIGYAATGSDGRAAISHTIPWKTSAGYTIPCNTINFEAADESTGATSSKVSGKVAFRTRISITAPGMVEANQLFIMEGKLEYESASGVWSGLAGKTVSLYYNGTKIMDVTTSSDGSYTASAKIATAGSYTLKAAYAGEGLTAVAIAMITVPETVRPIITPLAAILVGGATIALIKRKR